VTKSSFSDATSLRTNDESFRQQLLGGDYVFVISESQAICLSVLPRYWQTPDRRQAFLHREHL